MGPNFGKNIFSRPTACFTAFYFIYPAFDFQVPCVFFKRMLFFIKAENKFVGKFSTLFRWKQRDCLISDFFKSCGHNGLSFSKKLNQWFALNNIYQSLQIKIETYWEPLPFQALSIPTSDKFKPMFLNCYYLGSTIILIS